jgi:hypothetical protein
MVEKKKEWYQEVWVIVLFIILILVVAWNYSGIFDNKEGSRLNEQGYEVLEIGSYEFGEEETAYVDMKSWGSRNDQVWAGLISLAISYPNANKYSVSIIEERRDCLYQINEVILSPYLGNDIPINVAKIKETISYLIWSGHAKLEYEKYINNEESDLALASSYQRLMETGMDTSHLFSIIDYLSDDPSRCE